MRKKKEEFKKARSGLCIGCLRSSVIGEAHLWPLLQELEERRSVLAQPKEVGLLLHLFEGNAGGFEIDFRQKSKQK